MTMRQRQFLLLLCLFATTLWLVLAAQANPTNSPELPAPAPPSGETVTQPSQDIILEYSPPPAEYARAKSRSIANYRHFFVNPLYGLLVLLVLLRWRVAPSFRNLAERVSSRRSVQIIVFVPLILLTIAVLGIPSDIWDHSLDLAFGRSVQSWPAWLTDWITNEIVVLIIATVLVAILYAVIRRSPRRWWLPLLDGLDPLAARCFLPEAPGHRSSFLHLQAACYGAAAPGL
jgi:STE24 endopeptidase